MQARSTAHSCTPLGQVANYFFTPILLIFSWFNSNFLDIFKIPISKFIKIHFSSNMLAHKALLGLRQFAIRPLAYSTTSNPENEVFLERLTGKDEGKCLNWQFIDEM